MICEDCQYFIPAEIMNEKLKDIALRLLFEEGSRVIGFCKKKRIFIFVFDKIIDCDEFKCVKRAYFEPSIINFL